MHESTNYMTVKPYKSSEEGKKNQIKSMFDNIAPKYDFLNHSLSLGVDKIWRRRAINLLKGMDSPVILDIATGTGDLAIASLRLKPQRVVGLDLSPEMLKVAEEKIKRKNLHNIISMIEAIPKTFLSMMPSLMLRWLHLGCVISKTYKKDWLKLIECLKKGASSWCWSFQTHQRFLLNKFISFILLKYYLGGEDFCLRTRLPIPICLNLWLLSLKDSPL